MFSPRDTAGPPANHNGNERKMPEVKAAATTIRKYLRRAVTANDDVVIGPVY
jgi:hypothetical protein